MEGLQAEMVQLLRKMIAIPSISREEQQTAALLTTTLSRYGFPAERIGNNVIAIGAGYKKGRPTILLNSHHDTVKPNPGYTRNPFSPDVEDGKLYGLGSNDAGGCLVALLGAFLYLQQAGTLLNYNLVFAATAEEEISGKGGVEMILSRLGKVYLGIVGEPTLLKMAVAEKGLMVLDCTVMGVAGHAARNEGENALYKAMQDIEWFRTYQFSQVSELLGEVKMTVTGIQAGTQHNIVPASCQYTVDVRTTELCNNEDVLSLVQQHVQAQVVPRSLRLKASGIDAGHVVIKAAGALGIDTFGSPTISDQALMPFPTIKIGPGDSARSHMANEFVFIREIEEGMQHRAWVSSLPVQRHLPAILPPSGKTMFLLQNRRRWGRPILPSSRSSKPASPRIGGIVPLPVPHPQYRHWYSANRRHCV